MILAKVVGSVWGGRETPSLSQSKLLQVQPVRFGPTTMEIRADGPEVPLFENVLLAMDTLGAGVGEYVLVAHGSRVRDLTVGPDLPTKDVVIAIVDAGVVETGTEETI